MIKRILILGASGTVGSAIFKHLSLDENLKIFGTCFSAAKKSPLSMIYFSVESPDDIFPILEQVRPDIVISSLRGAFDKQLITHKNIAKYLNANNGRMIYFSTANVFDGDCDRPHYETDTRNSVSDYGQFKIRCEDLLLNQMGDRAVLISIPFVWGKNSPRIKAVKDGCENGQLNVYTDFFSNHVSDMQIAHVIQWIIREDKDGIFHIGTSDVVNYQYFTEQLITEMDLKPPEFVYRKNPGIMALLSHRNDIPDNLRWDSRMLIQYLCDRTH